MTNLATSARWLGGNALNCLITACALMLRTNHHRESLASVKGRQNLIPLMDEGRAIRLAKIKFCRIIKQ
jgi:hypothetical protein